MDGTEADLPLAYRSFARQAGGYCPEYERLALGVADDAELLRRLSDLPQSQRQPNLLFGVTRLLGGPVENWPDFRSWVLAHWWQVHRELLRRSTQTNEAGRCATLLPYLPLDRPLALLELGCSAGLCLHPDRYGYRYTGTDRSTAPVLLAGEQEPLLDCRLGVGITPPAGLPQIAWRAGLDLNPLDLRRPDNRAWLRALVWPGQPIREARLDAAMAVATADPPRLFTGDLVDDLPTLLDDVPAGVTPVIFHSAVLAYVTDPQLRAHFVGQALWAVEHRGAVWIANEAPTVLGPQLIPDHGSRARLLDAAEGRFLLTVNGEPRAWAGPHGQSLDRLDH